MALGFWMNNKNCYGCKTCSIACKSEKQLNEGVLLRKVSCIRQDSPVNVSFLSMSCNHCEDPACVKACPVEAYTKLDNGIVKQDHDKCIGCKMCIEACPYNAPCYDEEESKTYKCDMCYDRQQNHQADIVSDENSGTKPNFVITADPKLNKEPDDSAMEQRDVEVDVNTAAADAAKK